MTEIQADSTNCSSAGSPVEESAAMATASQAPPSVSNSTNVIVNTDITTVDTSAINSTTMPLHVTPQPQANTTNSVVNPIPSNVSTVQQAPIQQQHQQMNNMVPKPNGNGTPLAQQQTLLNPVSAHVTNVTFAPTQQATTMYQQATVVGQPHFTGQHGQQTTAVPIGQAIGQPVAVSCAQVRPSGGATLQQVQVIPQQIGTGQPFLASPYIQQQLMFQTMQGIAPQQLNVAVQPNRVGNNTAKGNQKTNAQAQSGSGKTQGNATAVSKASSTSGATNTTQKTVIQRQANQAQPVVIGSLVFTTPQGQQKGQLGGTPTQIRLGSPTTLMTSTGQIIGAPQILNLSQLQAIQNIQNISQGNQQPAMLGSQPVYIRAAGLQTAQGLINPTIQAVQPQRNVPSKVQALVQPTTRSATNINQPQMLTKTAQVQPTLQPAPPQQQQRNVQRVKALKQQQIVKHSATEQHMATLSAAVVPRPPVQLKPKLPTGPPVPIVQNTSTTTSTATVMPTVLAVRPTVSPPIGSPMVVVGAPVADKDDASKNIADRNTDVSSPAKRTAESKVKYEAVINKKTGPRKGTKKIEKNKIITPSVINIAPASKCEDQCSSVAATTTIEVSSNLCKSTTTTAPMTTTMSEQEVAAVLSDIKEEPMEGEKIYGDDVIDRADQSKANNNNILKHVIEGYIIEEGPEPFPVYRTSLFEKTKKLTSRVNTIQRDNDSEMDVTITGAEQRTAKELRQEKKTRRRRAAKIPDDAILTCEFCHKADVARKFRRSKRFCSVPCAKRYNVGCSRRVKPVHLLANYVSGKGDAALLRCEMCSKVGVGMKFRSFRRFCSWTCIKKYKLANPSSLVKRTRKAKLKLKHKSEDMQSLHTHLSEVQLSQGVVIPSGVTIAQGSSTNLSCTTTPMDTSSEQLSVAQTDVVMEPVDPTRSQPIDITPIKQQQSVIMKTDNFNRNVITNTVNKTNSSITTVSITSSNVTISSETVTCVVCGKQEQPDHFYNEQYCSVACSAMHTGPQSSQNQGDMSQTDHMMSPEGAPLPIAVVSSMALSGDAAVPNVSGTADVSGAGVKHKDKKKKKRVKKADKQPAPTPEQPAEVPVVSEPVPVTLPTISAVTCLKSEDEISQDSSISSSPATSSLVDEVAEMLADDSQSSGSPPASPMSQCALGSPISQEGSMMTGEDSEAAGSYAASMQESSDNSTPCSSPAMSPPVLVREPAVSREGPSSRQEVVQEPNAVAPGYAEKPPVEWTVLETYEFIRDLPGCTIYADEFMAQEIDGQALMLLKEDHLMQTMNMKLGPALKICAKINELS